MYDNVLVPTDGSEQTLAALEHAQSLVTQYDATLHTVHVVQTTGVTAKLDTDQFEEVIQRIERAGEQAVKTIRKEVRDDGITDVRTAVVHGTPARAVIEYVDQHSIDLVVMATAGRTGDERSVVGSVTERVVRTSPVPVLTVNVGRDG